MSLINTLLVALTGGIGSGKSEAAKQFVHLGVPVIDTDEISRALTSHEGPMIESIRKSFGDDFFKIDGSLDRAKLRQQIFRDPAKRQKLEAIMHPAIYELAVKQLTDNETRLNPQYQVLVVPLLFENNRYQSLVDKVLLIDCHEKLQIERAMARSQLSAIEVNEMMSAQVPRSTRLAQADEIIENNGSLAELQEKIIVINKKFISSCIVSK